VSVAQNSFELIVVGSGIVGLAHALEGAKRGLRVCVIERDAQPVGASIRNFGFITVTGQAAGDTHRRARVSRDVWEDVAVQAGIPILQRGLWLVGQRPEAQAVLHDFLQTEMGEQCEILSHAEVHKRNATLKLGADGIALYSPHELRVESREAIPKLIDWLCETHGVTFRFAEAVLEIAAPHVRTSRAHYQAERVVYCPGTVLNGLFAERIDAYELLMCRLQMLRVKPARPIDLPGAVMMDLSLIRYEGYSQLPSAAALRLRLEREEADTLAAGIHLIVVQSADGSLVVGDSHHYDHAPHPFASAAVEQLILRHLADTIDVGEVAVSERWIGEYPRAADHNAIIDTPDDATRLVLVTSGTGASTAFALAQDVFSDW
jgi:D-hydroxyproline dehydrogenase subunit beta